MDARQADLLREIDPKVLGQRVRAARRAAALTQAQVAGGEISVAYVSRIESGQRRPDRKVLDEIAGRMGIPMDHLLSGVSEQAADELRLTLDYAELSLESGEPHEAEARALEVIRNDAVRPEPAVLDRAQYLHARALEAQGRLDEAVLALERLTSQMAHDVHWVRACIALSRCYRESGELASAVEVGAVALATLRSSGLEASDEGIQLAVTVAAAHYERGETRRAVRLCLQAVELAEQTGSATARASAYWNASMLESERGAVRSAIPLAERALALLGEGRDVRNLARLRSQLGIMQLRLDPPELVEAEKHLKQAAVELASSSAGAADQARNKLALARANFLRGQPGEARLIAATVQAEMHDVAPLIAADATVLEGQAAAAQGDAEYAKQSCRRAVLLLTGIGADQTAAQLWFELGGMLEEIGELEEARVAYRSAAASTGLQVRASLGVPAS